MSFLNTHHLALSTLVCALLAPTLAPSQDPAPKTYLGREIAQTMHWMGASWLIRHKRDQEEASVEMREQLTLKPGMVACDMGSGNGYHTIPMAKAVAPHGKVFASEIQQEMLTMLDERAKKEGINNIVPVLGTQTDAKLPDASCDLILLVDVDRLQFSDPEPDADRDEKGAEAGWPDRAGRVPRRGRERADQARAQDEQGANHEGNERQWTAAFP